jgi:hypothetical protein
LSMVGQARDGFRFTTHSVGGHMWASPGINIWFGHLAAFILCAIKLKMATDPRKSTAL